MGAMQNNKQEKNVKNSRRGSQNNKRRLDAFGKKGGLGQADWGGCDPTRLAGVIISVTELGGACTFGLSRDQGAHMLTLLLDDSKETLWFNGEADLDEALMAIQETLNSMR